jgi:hydrogenase small subunit
MKRRDFLKLAGSMITAFGLSNIPAPVHAMLKKLNPADMPKILYLQGQSCTGCSISMLQASHPSPVAMITRYSKLSYHTDLSAASGRMAMDIIENTITGKAGDYFLALEGSIPSKMPDACMIGEKTLQEILLQAGKTTKAAIAVGSCATNGGVPGAEGNETGAVSLRTLFNANHIGKMVINIPGCPVHPDWIWQTVIHIAEAGMPELDRKFNRPTRFFGKSLHENCPRYHFYQEEIFAKNVGEEGCLFKIGCMGPITNADCPTRWWNNGTTWCIDANAPCIGCASMTFAHSKNRPFYRANEKHIIPQKS